MERAVHQAWLHGFAVGPEELGSALSNASDSMVATSWSRSALELAQKLTTSSPPSMLVLKNVFQIDAPSLLSLKSVRKKGRPLINNSIGPESRCMPCACRPDSPDSNDCLLLSTLSWEAADGYTAILTNGIARRARFSVPSRVALRSMTGPGTFTVCAVDGVPGGSARTVSRLSRLLVTSVSSAENPCGRL